MVSPGQRQAIVLNKALTFSISTSVCSKNSSLGTQETIVPDNSLFIILQSFFL